MIPHAWTWPELWAQVEPMLLTVGPLVASFILVPMFVRAFKRAIGIYPDAAPVPKYPAPVPNPPYPARVPSQVGQVTQPLGPLPDDRTSHLGGKL